jgi:hypothetical protein
VHVLLEGSPNLIGRLLRERREVERVTIAARLSRSVLRQLVALVRAVGAEAVKGVPLPSSPLPISSSTVTKGINMLVEIRRPANEALASSPHKGARMQ